LEEIAVNTGPDGPIEREADRQERAWARDSDHDEYNGEYPGEGEEGAHDE
jgi:hypothetical protein